MYIHVYGDRNNVYTPYIFIYSVYTVYMLCRYTYLLLIHIFIYAHMNCCIFQDFSDGGAFPECQVAQYPLSMGKGGGSGGGGGGGSGGSSSSTSNAIAVQLDDKGKVKYDVLARQGHGKDKVLYAVQWLLLLLFVNL